MSKNNKNTSFFLPTIVIGFLTTLIFYIYLSSNNALPTLKNLYTENATSTKMILAPNGVVNAEIADTSELKQRGLGGRTSMNDDHGMLFVFEAPGIYGFWMKDMNIPIDMVWIDDQYRVVSIDSNIATSTYPNSYFPPKNVSYVLELNAGVAKKIGIATGTPLKVVL